MQVTFGIDVSKSTSTICELIGESKNELTITNDHPGFIQLLIISIGHSPTFFT